MTDQLPKLPPPLCLNIHDQNIGIRLQLLFDADAVLRLAVVLSAGGEEWPPFFCENPKEAHEQVRALFSLMDCYGPVSIGTKVIEYEHDCWSWPEDERDDTDVVDEKETNL